MFHLWCVRRKWLYCRLYPCNHIWPLNPPPTTSQPPAQASSVEGPRSSHPRLWHLSACCFTFAWVCCKWACWTLKHLAETTSKSGQDPFTAAFFWETALKWSWVLVALKEGKTASRLGRQGALSEQRSSTQCHCGCSESGRGRPAAGLYPVLCHPPPLSAFCFPELVRSKCDDAAAAMTCEDVDNGVTIFIRQHIVMERALV